MMDGDIMTRIANGTPVDEKVLHTLQSNFKQVQDILDQNRLLIKEIDKNHDSKIPQNLTRNVRLIRELNNNIKRVVDIYADLTSSSVKSSDNSSEEESAHEHDGRLGEKIIRPDN